LPSPDASPSAASISFCSLAAAALLLALTATGCATSRPVDLAESRRVLGTENQVRVDAEVWGDRLSSASTVTFRYDITNQRAGSIAIAELMPVTSYDPETQTVTVDIGSDVPGENFLPRLIVIGPGEKKSFSGVARVNVLLPAERASAPAVRYPNALQLKLNFLNDPQPFAQLVGMAERGVHDPKLAAALFPQWLDRNEVVLTNTLPMRWGGEDSTLPSAQGRKR
jgi:hypothetical protein